MWGETLQLDVLDESKPLTLLVMNGNDLSPNDFLGMATLDVRLLLKNEPTPKSLQLEDVAHGTLEVEVTWSPRGD